MPAPYRAADASPSPPDGGSGALKPVQGRAAHAGEASGRNFHEMLRFLRDEHDREVRELREQLAALKSVVGNVCPGAVPEKRAPNEDKVEDKVGDNGHLELVRNGLSLCRPAFPTPDDDSEPDAASDWEVGRGPEAPRERGSGCELDRNCEPEVAVHETDGSSEANAAGQRGSKRLKNEDQELERAPPKKEKNLFVDANAMKEKIRQAALKPEYNVANFYKKAGIWRYIALHPAFEKITLTVIAFNALWIWIDTDENPSELITEAPEIFQIVENFFCVFFSFEWACRFNAFAKKINCLRDGWFVFDSCLVLFMVLETWIMSIVIFAAGGAGFGGNLSIMRIARLLRLSRMARMVRLFRVFPELLILIKGMMAAMRSVFFTLCLLTVILYVFGIAFTQLVGKSLPEKFDTVSTSMHTLLLDGTLLDGAGYVIRSLANIHWAFVVLFYLFILLAALTVMNMLIGVLCEVVSAVAATEKEGIQVAWMKGQLATVWERVHDGQAGGEISKADFQKILGSVNACRALEEAGVDPIGLVDNIDFIFAGEVEDDEGNVQDKMLSFTDFVALVLTLRGSNSATVKDIVDLRKYFNKSINKLREDLRKTSRAGLSISLAPKLY